jgi:hypothetical protein
VIEMAEEKCLNCGTPVEIKTGETRTEAILCEECKEPCKHEYYFENKRTGKKWCAGCGKVLQKEKGIEMTELEEVYYKGYKSAILGIEADVERELDLELKRLTRFQQEAKGTEAWELYDTQIDELLEAWEIMRDIIKTRKKQMEEAV